MFNRISNLLIVNCFFILILGILCFSCEQRSKNYSTLDIDKIQAAMLGVELKDSSPLFILITKDGTINRKGDLKSPGKDFFMGVSKDNLFDKLINTVTNDLLSYCGRVHVLADTSKSVNKVLVGFSGNGIETGFEYYTDEPMDKFPKPILEFINNAIEITDTWFKSQQEMIRP